MKRSRLVPVLLSFFIVLALTFAAAEFQKKVQPVAGGGTIKGLPDIAYDAQSGKYLVVWQDRTGRNAGDWDVKARLLDSDGNPAGRVMHLAASAEDERQPRAAATGAGSWTVVWSTGRSIEACAVDAEGKIDGFRSVTPGTGRPVDHPGIGFSSLDGRFFVVWEELDELGLNVIKGRSIGGPGEDAGDAIVLGRSTYNSLQNPSVNQAGGKFFVAWEKPVAAGRIDIEGREVPAGAASADVLGRLVAVAADGARNTDPSVTGVPGTAGYVVVWQARRGARRSEIAFADIGGDGILLAGDLTATESQLESRPSAFAAGLAGRILVTYQTAGVETPAVRDVAARTIGWGDAAASGEVVLDEERSGGGNPAIVRATGADGRGIIVWDVRDGGGTELFSRGWQEASTAATVAAKGPIVPLADVTISGQVTLGGLGQADVLVGGLPSAVRTDALGFYTAMVPSGWTGTVTPAEPGYTFGPASRTYTNLAVDATGQDYAAAFAGGVDDAYEDNDTFETAASLPLGTTHDLVLNDEEWFKFYVPAEDAGKDLKVRVWGTGFPDATTRRDLDFGILDASGRLLSYSLSGTWDETAFICGVAEGWYYVVQNYVGAVGTVYSMSAEVSDAFGLAYVSGHVMDEDEQPIAGASVELYGMPFDWNITRPLVFTDANGFYKLGWYPGDFTLRFNTQDFGEDGIDWTPDANYLGDVYQFGHVLTLTAGVSVENADMYLTAGGTITGRITDGTGSPIANATAQVWLGNGTRVAGVFADGGGVYRVHRLRDANYAVRARSASGPMISEWYDDRALFASADPVGTVAGAATSAIDLQLEEKTWGGIAGRVTDSEGNPVADLQVAILDPVGLSLWTARTDASGHYLQSRVPAGDWKVFFNAASMGAGLVPEYYPGTRFLAEATAVHVAAGTVTDGINAVLPAAGSISGRILNNNGNVAVIAFDTAGNFQWSVSPNIPLAGETTYVLDNLPPGSYKVLARPSQQGDRIPHWYPDATSYGAAGTVTVSAGATAENVDITLPGGGGMIVGRVVNAYGNPIPRVNVVAEDASREISYAAAVSDGDGYFTIRQVPPGPAKVYFNADANWLPFASEFYNDKTSHGAADAITVNESETTALSDAALAVRPSLAIATTSLAGGELAVAYSQQLVAEGGRPLYRWTLYSGALPPGLSMNARGEISGTPTTEGTFDFAVTVTDSSSGQVSLTRGLSITIGGYTGLGFTVTGTVTAGGVPLAGVTLDGFEQATVTDSQGRYAAVVQRSWWGTVRPVRSGYAFDPPLREYVVVSSNLASQDYTASPGHLLSGGVTLNGAGQGGVLMAGLPAALRTNSGGSYSMMLPDGWSGTVTPTLPGFTFSPASRDYASLGSDATGQDYASTFGGGVDDPYEDNDSFAAAAEIPLGSSIGDLILNDADWFKVYVPAEAAGKILGVRIRPTSFPNGSAVADPTQSKDADFAVLDSTGRLVSYNISGDVDEAAFIPNIAPGWYYIAQTYIAQPGMVYSLYAGVSDVFPVGTVSGRVTDGAGQGIDGVTVELYGVPFDWNLCRPMGVTDADGNYRIAFFPGTYQVKVNQTDFHQNPNDGYPDDWLPVRNFLPGTYDYGKPVTLELAAAVTGVDVRLEAGGVVSGRITDSGGNPLDQAIAFAYRADRSQASLGFTDAAGNYVIRRLRTANYAVGFRAPAGNDSAGREWYNDRSSFDDAVPVAVVAGATTTGIDASLGAAARISGRVTNENGDPLAGVQVTPYDGNLAMQSATTQADGTYVVGHLAGGSVKVLFNATTCGAGNYMSMWYADGAAVPLAAGQTTSGINGVLPAAGAIGGKLSDNTLGSLPSHNVLAVGESNGQSFSSSPDYEGNYFIRNLPPDTYRVRFVFNAGALANIPVKWFGGSASYAAATPIPVTAGSTVSGIDGALEPDGGSISGRVTDINGDPIPGLTVAASDSGWSASTSVAVTAADGSYTIANVPAGRAKVFFNADANASPYVSEYYSDQASHGGATEVAVAPGETTAGIDAVLAFRPALTITTTSLPDGRVAVPYVQNLAATGGRAFYHGTLIGGSLPVGLTLSPMGQIRGTPTTAGEFTFTVQATDSTSPQQTATRELTITIGAYAGAGYLVSGTVTAGGTPLAGATMSGLPGSPATNAAGGYIAAVPSGWSGTVTPVLSGYAFSPATRAYENVSANAAGQDYAAAAGYRITGTVTLDGAGLAGVTMAGLPGAPATDSAGAYAAAVPAGWSGTVTPTSPGFTFSPADRAYDAIAADATAQDYGAAFAGGVDDAFEDNDTFETAAALPMGRTSGLILRDEDWFKFYVSGADAGKDIRVALNGIAYPDQVARRDIDFAILDADKRLLGYNTSGGDDETAYIYGAAEGWYYIANTYISVPGIVYSVTIDANADFGLAYVTGTVTDDSGNPIAGAYVELYGSPFNWDVSRSLVMTGEDGTYRIGYTPGSYTVQFNATDFNDDLDWTPDVNYLAAAYHGGEVLTLAAGETLAEIDGRLTPGGVISGRITDLSGNPLSYAVAYAYAGDAVQAAGDVCDADGHFEIDRLRAGNYAVRFRAPGGSPLATEWHSEAAQFADAMPVAVAAGETTGGIDAVLGTAGAIAGRITDEEDNPIAGVQVTAYDPAGMALQSATTNADGNYSVGRLPTGTFKILFNASTAESGNYLAEYYPDVYDLNSAAGIGVTAGETTGGINAVLGIGGTISGTLKAADGHPLSGANVYAFPPDNSFYVTATTDVTGAYTIRGVPPTDYRVRFRPASEDLTVKWYNDRAGFAAADVVTVALGANVTGIDGVLSNETGLITGRVTNGSGLPVEGVTVAAQDASLAAVCYSTTTDADGRYTLRRMPTAPFKVFFNPNPAYLNYLAEYYNDKGGHGDADAVEVTVGNTTSGIDAVLAERPALAVTTESLGAGELGAAYSGNLAASGGRAFYLWSLEFGSLPDGLSLDGRGRISGVPAMAGTFAFIVRVTDSTSPQQASTKELSITIGEYTGLGHTISGRITAGGLPLAGVTMNGLPGTPTTTSAGSYVAVVGDGWSGTVRPTLTGYAFTPATRTYDNVTASASGQDFAAYVPRAISGTVTLNSAGLAGVLMSGLPGDPVTGGDGTYAAQVPDGWSGTVTPTLAGYAFTPANRTYTAVTADVTGQDYAAAVSVAKEDLLATWDGQGVYYKNSDTGGWVKLASPATMVAAGDLDGDGIDDLIGLWPGQGGIWVKSSHTGAWAKLSSTAVHIAAGDMNGDGREDLLGTWDGQGVFYRNSIGGAWVKLASPATLITTGDLDGDGTDDLVGIWPSQGGVWAKYSRTGAWAKLSSTARDICVGDANGDGRDDLIATWDGQGVFYRNSISGAWVKMASVATQVACGDLDGDGKADLIGIWPTQGGVWVKYSKTGAWALLGSTAKDISAGRMRAQGGASAAAASPELAAPAGGQAEGPEAAARILDLADDGPGGPRFRPEERGSLTPGKGPASRGRAGQPGPGERGFKFSSQANLSPGSGNGANPGKGPKKLDKPLKKKG